MRSALVLAAAGTAFLAASSLTAQWLNYPTPGVPKTSDGKVNLNAPAPKSTDGKLDFSGLWEHEKNMPCPPGGCADGEVGHEFVDIGWSLKGGLPYQPWARDLVQERRSQSGKDDPGSHCLPVGLVKMHTSPFLKKVVQVPGLIVILNESNAMYRQIFTDGRPLPEDPLPSWTGYSTGKWDGDTLVVQTNGIRNGTWLDRNGSPLTDEAKITERFRRPTYGHLEIELTVNDPKAYTAPWTIKMNQFLVLNSDLLDAICLENEKDISHYVGK